MTGYRARSTSLYFQGTVRELGKEPRYLCSSSHGKGHPCPVALPTPFSRLDQTNVVESSVCLVRQSEHAHRLNSGRYRVHPAVIRDYHVARARGRLTIFPRQDQHLEARQTPSLSLSRDVMWTHKQ